jgi:hypothetical protein
MKLLTVPNNNIVSTLVKNSHSGADIVSSKSVAG